jgi:predicted PurR-regulated permease PerM
MEEQTLMQQLLQIIIPFAVAAVSALTTWALYELKKWIKARTDSQALDDAMIVLENVVQSTVAKINETVREVGADGVITAEDGVKLKTAAMRAINDQLPPATKKILEIANKELQDFISGKVEVAVLTTKRLKMEAGSA